MSDQQTYEHTDFSTIMVDILNAGALNLALGIGYRTRLFDIMAEFDTPQSAAAIAGQSGLNERYIREWLGIMATGGIVTLSESGDGESLYLLPQSHAALLTRKAGSNNLGVYTQEIPLLTTLAMEPVIDGFSTGEGVPYERYPKFQAFMSELGNAKHRRVLVDEFLPSVDNGVMIERLRSGIRVCDLGCGEGVAVHLMAEAFPNSTFTGIDIDPDAIASAEAVAQKMGLVNAVFEIRDASRISDDPSVEAIFDYITAFDAIHDQTDPLGALEGIYHMLAQEGCFSMIDIAAHTRHADNMDHPMAPFLYTVSLMHCMPVGLVNGGAGLGMMWGQARAVQLLAEAGFADAAVQEIPNDPFNLHFFCRKSSGSQPRKG